MSDSSINRPAAAGLPGGVRPTDGASSKSRLADANAPAAPARPEFRALLERLNQKADDLREAGDGANDAQGLGHAVAQAKESLDEVLGLKDQLLEAYARQQLLNDNTPKD